MKGVLAFIATIAVVGALLSVYVATVMWPRLPSMETLTDYRPKVPLRVYTADHVLIGEFGTERRTLVQFKDVPDVMKKAILAAEDDRFYKHGGVDYIGILRAGWTDITHASKLQGGSTITMQVAKNFFMTNDKDFSRKFYQMLLAYKIERALTKDQILELYMNQIYLGERAYGFAEAERVYFGKDIKDITLAEAAVLAGLPKGPSANNPVVNLKRAKERQQYILHRMLELRYITQQQYDQAINQPLDIKGGGHEFSVHAEYVAEMVRQMMYAQYGDAIYTRGLSVVTTIDSVDQQAAYEAVRKGIMAYEHRRGYRGPEDFVNLPDNADDREDAIDDALSSHPNNGDIVAAVVTRVTPGAVVATLSNGSSVTVQGNGLRFASAALSPRASNAMRIRPGSVIRLVADDTRHWQITQLPQVQGALVSLVPQDGAIRALVGGFDFNQSNDGTNGQFNRVTQAWRQPGSSFKPFVYSASLEKGLGPASIINDAPISIPPAETGGQLWDPKDDDQPQGPMPMRLALQKSKNLVSIRILQFIGTQYAQDFVTKNFGFDVDKTPPYLPMALGAGSVTPLQSAAAYSVFANGGYRVNPYLITEVDDPYDGRPLSQAHPLVAGQNAPRTISPRNAYIMNSLLHSVATGGTGAGTNVLNRNDLQGKTGTTNEARDGWFAGYQRSLVTVAWMGYDQPKSLGSRAFGANLALPIWVDYMRVALRNTPQDEPPMPADITTIGGELYFSDATPGHGFVTNIGMNDAGAASPDAASGAPTDAGGSPAPVTPDEKQQIMDMFKQDKQEQP